MSPLAPALQAFFTDRLITQRNSSPQTIAAYRDTFRLLLRFAHAQTGKLIVAAEENEIAGVEGIAEAARANGVDDLQWLTAAQAHHKEANPSTAS